MATRSEIRGNIENTREHISDTIDQISNTLHKRVDVQEKIKDNPYGALAVAVGVGFLLSTFSSPIGRSLLRFALKSATAAAGAYVSKQGMSYLTHRLKTH